MRDTPKNFTAPRLAIWTSAGRGERAHASSVGVAAPGSSGGPGCAVFVSFATSKLHVNVDRLTIGLLERGFRFEGITRSNVQAVPPGLVGVAETPWDGSDPVDCILALVDSTVAPAARHRTVPRSPAAAHV